MSQYDITFKTFAEHPRKIDEFKKDYYDRISGIVGKSALTIKDHYTLYVSKIDDYCEDAGLQPKM